MVPAAVNHAPKAYFWWRWLGMAVAITAVAFGFVVFLRVGRPAQGKTKEGVVQQQAESQPPAEARKASVLISQDAEKKDEKSEHIEENEPPKNEDKKAKDKGDVEEGQVVE